MELKHSEFVDMCDQYLENNLTVKVFSNYFSVEIVVEMYYLPSHQLVVISDGPRRKTTEVFLLGCKEKVHLELQRLCVIRVAVDGHIFSWTQGDTWGEGLERCSSI